MLLGLYSYFTIVELSPTQPSAIEILVWVWAATMWLEEFRQVCIRHLILILYYSITKIRECQCFCKILLQRCFDRSVSGVTCGEN